MKSFESLAEITDAKIGHTEEDVKVNVIIPWLELLGHDRHQFEHEKTDILISYPNVSPIVVETKKLGVNLVNYIDQIQKYAYQKRAFLAVLTNAKEFLLFSPFWRMRSFEETLILSFSRNEINETPVKMLLMEIMSEESVTKGSAMKALEKREKYIEEVRNSMREKKSSLEQRINELSSQIEEYRKKITELEAEHKDFKGELLNLEKDTLKKDRCWYDFSGSLQQRPSDHTKARTAPSRERESWVDYCKEALENLGGRARLKEMYEEVRRLKDNAGEEIISNLDAAVRNTLEKNSRGKGQDIFEPEEVGSGFWRLKK